MTDKSKIASPSHENPKLNALQNQIKNVVTDFQEMIKAREEAKKNLELRFADVYSKVQSCKDFTISEANKICDSLRAFQSQFEIKLTKIET